MDVLSDVLGVFRLKARVFFHSSFCGRWSVNTSGNSIATFHLVSRGNCWLHMPDKNETVPLRGGDLVVFPRDAAHILCDRAELDGAPGSGVIRSDEADGPSTSLICGYFEFDTARANPILEALPDAVHIRGEDEGNMGWLATLMRFLVAETEAMTDGSSLVIDRLSDVLFVHVVRTYLKQAAPDHGFLAALVDPEIGRALNDVHSRPGGHWTVKELAARAGMSRSSFAKRFQVLTGTTPMQYVTRWRMQRALADLETGKQSVAALAERYGYGNEASFRKAFRKHVGRGPGEVRREAARRADHRKPVKTQLRYVQSPEAVR